MKGASFTRAAEAIHADMRAAHARYSAEISALMAELDGGALQSSALGGASAAERRQSKKAAAGELGLTERRLMSLVVRYHDAHPRRQKLAVQPAGMRNSRWIVYTDRVRSVMDSGEPY